MERRKNWFWIIISTILSAGVFWALTYKICQDYFLLGLQGSIVIAVGFLIVWKLAFHLLSYMLRQESVNRIRTIVMAFMCGMTFAVWFPQGLELLLPGNQPNKTVETETPDETTNTVPEIKQPAAPLAPPPQDMINTPGLPATTPAKPKETYAPTNGSPVTPPTGTKVTPPASGEIKPGEKPKVEEKPIIPPGDVEPE